mgnify:FL=1
MKVVFVLQVLYGWTMAGGLLNMTLPNTHYYETFDQCKADADILQKEANKLPEQIYGARLIYVCRPSAGFLE